MKRDLAALERRNYDLLVVGGGIHGAFVAWDATLRGLSTALVERTDFGHSTSANSLKIIHGGLRYLKDGRPRRVRSMVREQRTWMRLATHLVRPLPVVMPTDRNPLRSRPLMKLALGLTDLAGLDWREGHPRLPRGTLLTRQECRRILGGYHQRRFTGAALWYDCQIENTERLLLAVVQSAADQGASVANYVELVQDDQPRRDTGRVRVRDRCSGAEFSLGARIVVNCAGPAVASLARFWGCSSLLRSVGWSRSVNLVVRRQIFETSAVAVPWAPRDARGMRSPLFFIAPWRTCSILGTLHHPVRTAPTNSRSREEDVREFLAKAERALPGLALDRSEVCLVHEGHLPAVPNPRRPERVKLLRDGMVFDHERQDGVPDLISVVGVKYTSARDLAERAVDLTCRKLGKRRLPSRTERTPLTGVEGTEADRFLGEIVASRPDGVSPELAGRVAQTYGAASSKIFALIAERPRLGAALAEGIETTGAEVVHAVRHEMALTLDDVVRRRTELGSVGSPPADALRGCADLVADELDWDAARKEREVRSVEARFARQPAGAAED